jgi:thiosulfate reductase cytochrome b subunit
MNIPAASRLLSLALLLGAVIPLQANELHPAFPMLDASERPVVLSGRPLSTMKTCGGCHDSAYIAGSSDHADAGAAMLGQPAHYDWAAGPGFFGGWDPLRYDLPLASDGSISTEGWLQKFGARHVGGGPASEWLEMDCLMCHSDLVDPAPRARAIAEGDYAWANSARLARQGILLQEQGRWQWNAFMFQPDGTLNEGLLEIRKPLDANCAQCHGQAAAELEPPLTISPDPAQRSMTERSGQLFSPQKLNNSGLNLAGKEALTHPFDVHADRVVGCVNCHYSLNNPVYYQQRPESRPPHLDFDPRRLTLSEYLQRPLHQFAKGSARHGLAAIQSENSLRRCESCHEATNVHEWLPYRQRHFTALACEACHIPQLHGPALQMLDWTLVDADGSPRRVYRDVDGDPSTADSLIQGFRPVMLARSNAGESPKLAPFNLVSSWYWLAGEPPRPVGREQLVMALYRNGRLHPDLLAQLDTDGDGRLSDVERRLDSEEKAAAVHARLEAAGLRQVRMTAGISPFAVNHNVVNGRWATRDCRSCHGADSVLGASFALAEYLPGGLLPELQGFDNPGEPGVVEAAAGGAGFRPITSREGFYIIGLDNVPWVDIAGLLMFFGIVLGVTLHAVARWSAGRKRPRPSLPKQRIYMYDAYDRLWHWLQASAILLLIFTGLIIHKPHFFGMFSFAYVVQVHNVLGFILLINAALALFYTLASGTIKRFLPEPKDFFGRAVAQAMYYSRGIFAGAAHPLEKTPENRLNPLQQITYLAILNVLLPAQVVTGVLIWGMQKWPQLAAALGGLPVLAPLHTLLAWAFAAFIVMHVYLTTAAGETPGAGIRSMISGWEEVDAHDGAESKPRADNSTEVTTHV